MAKDHVVNLALTQWADAVYLNSEDYTEFLAQEAESVPPALVAVGLIREGNSR